MFSVKKVVFDGRFVRSFPALCDGDFAPAICSMEFFVSDCGCYGQIEWIINYLDNCEDVRLIGLGFNKDVLTDYEGVYPMPVEALNLVQSCGYKVQRYCA